GREGRAERGAVDEMLVGQRHGAVAAGQRRAGLRQMQLARAEQTHGAILLWWVPRGWAVAAPGQGGRPVGRFDRVSYPARKGLSETFTSRPESTFKILISLR